MFGYKNTGPMSSFASLLLFVSLSVSTAFCPSKSLPSDLVAETSTALQASKLPPGISPFEQDIPSSLRKVAATSIDRAIRDGCQQLEVDFPPFVGSKTQFDDFDNVQELNANSDWSVQLAPALNTNMKKWLVFPDDKETELAKNEWGGGQMFRRAAKFTSIRAAVLQVAGEAAYVKAWGSSIASTVNKLGGGDGILADSTTLDDLSEDVNEPLLYLVCQPGNGGPVEDWINVEKMAKAKPDAVTCIVNGALDKVRDGYYPALFFPALAATNSFYQSFEAAFVLKPISDKGVYGWLYRVYPEPWQVILQTARQKQKGSETVVSIEETVALESETRPSYAESVAALLSTASQAA